MTTLQDVITESTSYLEKITEKETITTEERVNSFLDNILELHRDIDSITAHFEKGITLLEKFTWIDIKTGFDAEAISEINTIKVRGTKAHSKGVREYVFFNNRFRGVAAKNLRALKNTLDHFRETLEEVYELLLGAYDDPELNEIEKRLEEL